jgi:PAS domain S-box-containing protein
LTTSPSQRVAADDLHRAVFDRSADALVVVNERLEIIEANATAGGLLGLPAESLIGRSIGEFSPEPSVAPSHLASLIRDPHAGDAFDAPVVLRRADGQLRHVEAVDVVEVLPGMKMLTLRNVIEQRNEAMSRRDARLRLAQSAGRLGTWDWDLRSNAISWSPELEQLHGLTPGTFDGTFEFLLSKMHPDDRAAFIAATDELKRDGQHYIEHRILLPDGSVRWVAGRGQLFRNDAGEGVWALGVCIDITERHIEKERLGFMIEAGRALGSSLDYEETLRRVATLAVPRIADWCSVHVLSEAGNPEVVALTHVNPEKVAWAQKLQERYPPDPDAATGVPAVVRSGKSELVADIPQELIDGLDEERRQILDEIGMRSYMCVPMMLRGRVLGAITFVAAESGRIYGPSDLEMAEHLADRAALAIENARAHRIAEGERSRLQSILSSVDYGVCQLDAAGRIRYMNRAAERLLAVALRDAEGKDAHDLLHGDACTVAGCELIAPGAAERSIRTVDEFRLGNGARRLPVEVGIAPVFVLGRVEGAVIVFQDITKRLQEEQTKDDFLAFASHELRNPLTPILGLSRWLDKRATEKPERYDADELDVMHALSIEADRMGRVVELFLDLSRIDAGHFTFDAEPLEIAGVAEVEAKSFQARQPEAIFELQLPDRKLYAISDESRLRQVLGNLLDNAAKYGGDPPHVRLTVTAEDGQAYMSVSNDGAGIPAEDQPHVFERFYRGSSEQHRKKKGLGVGLFLTREIVQQAGGEITLESGADGTTFRVRWPLRPPLEEALLPD